MPEQAADIVFKILSAAGPEVADSVQKIAKALAGVDPEVREGAVESLILILNGDEKAAADRAKRAAILAAAKKAIG